LSRVEMLAAITGVAYTRQCHTTGGKRLFANTGGAQTRDCARHQLLEAGVTPRAAPCLEVLPKVTSPGASARGAAGGHQKVWEE